MDMTQVSLAIMMGTLAALVYALRILVLLDKKVSKMMKHQGMSVDSLE